MPARETAKRIRKSPGDVGRAAYRRGLAAIAGGRQRIDHRFVDVDRGIGSRLAGAEPARAASVELRGRAGLRRFPAGRGPSRVPAVHPSDGRWIALVPHVSVPSVSEHSGFS